MKAYLVLVTWANGTEGLLFPRPGNVPVASTPKEGKKDFETAKEHLTHFLEQQEEFDSPMKKPITIRLVEFERGQVLEAHTVG
jgi:hypothetical protein